MLRDTLQPVPLKQVNGILYLYDSSRSKWISTLRQVVGFGINHKNVKSPRWMGLIGKVKTPYSGYRIPRDGVITAVTVQLSQNGSATFQIRKNSSSIIHTLTLSSQNGLTQDSLDIEINSGDYLQCRVMPSPSVSYPIVMVEISWRV